jgi:N-acetylglucosamine-6-phosphate deacetylase
MAQSVKPEGWDRAAKGPGARIRAARCFDGVHLATDVVLRVAGGRVSLSEQAGEGPLWAVPGLVTPGFVDLQVNGGGGVLLNSDPTPSGALAIARAHRMTGTAAILPTVITDQPEVTEAAAMSVAAALGQEGIAGIHIEGPHIAPARKGTHAADCIRPLDLRTMELVYNLRGRRVPVMITLAPEAVAAGQIAALVARGVIVAIGHSDATAAQVAAALAEGAQTFTHLFNAMSQMQGREPGVVGAAINSTAYASLIADGIHVSPAMLSLAIRARPVADRMILVSDAMPTVAGPDSFWLYGQRIALRDGRLMNDEGALAGAHVTMLESLRFMVDVLHQPLETALRMAITSPARLMGLDGLARLEARPANEVLLVETDLAACSWLM